MIHQDELEKKLQYFVQCLREGRYSDDGGDVSTEGVDALQDDIIEMFDEVRDEGA